MHYPTPKVKRLAETLVLEWPGKSCVQPQWGGKQRSGEAATSYGTMNSASASDWCVPSRSSYEDISACGAHAGQDVGRSPAYMLRGA